MIDRMFDQMFDQMNVQSNVRSNVGWFTALGIDPAIQWHPVDSYGLCSDGLYSSGPGGQSSRPVAVPRLDFGPWLG